MAFNLTANKVGQAEGLYAYMPNLPQVHNAIFTGAEGDTIHAGAVVKLDTASQNAVAPVVAKAEQTDKAYGVVVYDLVKDNYIVGDKLALAGTGDSIYMVAGGAIAVGDELEFDPATRKVVKGATANATLIGIAETFAGADGDYVQVKLNFNLGAVAGA